MDVDKPSDKGLIGNRFNTRADDIDGLSMNRLELMVFKLKLLDSVLDTLVVLQETRIVVLVVRYGAASLRLVLLSLR